MPSLRRILRFLKPYRKRVALAVSATAVVVFLDLLIPRLVQQIIDRGVAAGDLGVVGSTVLAMVGVVAVSVALGAFTLILPVRIAQSLAADVRAAAFRHIQTLSFGNLDRLQTGGLLVRLTSDVTLIQTVVLMSLGPLARMPIMLVGALIMLVATSASLALLLLVLLPLTAGIIWFFGTRSQPIYRLVQQKLERLNTVLQENLAGAQVVRAFVRADHENHRFDVANQDLTRTAIRVNQLVAVMLPMLMLMVNLGVVTVIWAGGNQVIAGSMTEGQVVASINYLFMMLMPIIFVGMIAPQVAAAEASAGRILEVLDSVPDIQERPGAVRLDPGEVRGRVGFEDVTFGYDSGPPVLEDVHLVAEPGETVAILGATGSGKSSLVNLVPRFYEVTSGRVTLDGVDVRDVHQDSLRRLIGVGLQEVVLFRGTVRDNIRYGRPDATDDQVVAAAQAAQAHEFISQMPDGYDDMVEQRGTNLSGGQRQRIALARALLTDPKVLILDDSTSAVDVETETRIQAALDRLMADRTTLVVAQRISTVLTADRIVVLDEGRVVAEGTHAELIADSQIYRDIYRSQLGEPEVSESV